MSRPHEPIGPPDETPDPPPPPGVAEGLQALYGRTPGVPAEVDERVLAIARRGRRAWWAGRPVWAGAAAAVLVMGAGLAVYLALPRGAAPPTGRATRPVDIVDALILAQELESGERPRKGWDFNADGHVDQADVDAIAMAAVKLPGGAS